MDENYSMMVTFDIMKGGNWWNRLFAKVYCRTLWRYFQIKGINELEDLTIQTFDRLDPSAPPKLGTNDRAIIHWRMKMPLKSRDAKSVWGTEHRRAIAAGKL